MMAPEPNDFTQRISIIPEKFDDGYLEELDQACWNCERPVADLPVGHRHMYQRGTRVLIEEWHRCECGAFANTLRWATFQIRKARKPK
jgi:hypothetical protein